MVEMAVRAWAYLVLSLCGNLGTSMLVPPARTVKPSRYSVSIIISLGYNQLDSHHVKPLRAKLA